MKKKLILGMTVLFMIIAVIFIACPSDSSSGGGDDAVGEENEDNPVILPGGGSENPDGKGGILLLEGDDVLLTVNVEEEDVTYQWFYYKENDPTIVKILGAEGKSYKFRPTENGIYFLYVEIYYDDGSKRTSAAIRIVVTDIPPNSTVAAKPLLTAPESAAYLAGTPADEVADLVVTVKVENKTTGTGQEAVGIIEYVWGMTRGGDEDAVEVPGTRETRTESGNFEATLTYKPDASTVGITYYYLKVTNTIPEGPNVPQGFESRFERSLPAARIEVVEDALPPRISTQPVNKLYSTENNFNSTKAPLKVVAVLQEGGTPSYQWYRIDPRGEDQTAAEFGTNEAECMPDPLPWNVNDGTDGKPKQSIYNYYCVVTNTMPEISGLRRTKTVQTETVYVGVGVTGLTLSGVTVNDKIYDGTKTATLNGTVVLSGAGTADVHLAYDRVEFLDADVKDNEDFIEVVLINSRLTGNDAGKYVLNKTNLKAKIKRADGAVVNAAPTKKGNPTSFKITVNELDTAEPASGLTKDKQAVEYGIGPTSTTIIRWQDSPEFTEAAAGTKLSANTNYYIFARSKQNGNYKTGANKNSSSITTDVGSAIDKAPTPIPTHWGFDIDTTAGNLVSVAEPSKGQIVEYAVSTVGNLTTNRTELDKLKWTENGSTSITGLENKANYYVYARAQKNEDYDSGAAKVSGVSMTLDPKVSFVCDRNEYAMDIPGVVVPKGQPLFLTNDQKELASSNPTGSLISANGQLSSAFYALDWYYEDEAKKEKPWDFDKVVNKSFELYVKWIDKDIKYAMENKEGKEGMVWVNGGWFTMGDDNNGQTNERPAHKVTLSGFWIGKYEVTQTLWRSVMNNNPSAFQTAPGEDPDFLPVDSINWYEAIEFCNKLTAKENESLPDSEKLQPVYTITTSAQSTTITVDWTKNGYRLPTEAEWEYACRAGTKTQTNQGNTINDNTGWYKSNSGDRTHEVGLKPPNAWGLYDMHGNLREWCWDNLGNYPSGSQINPKEYTGGYAYYRVCRGGCWWSEGSDGDLRSADRGGNNNRNFGRTDYTLRVVRR